MQSMVQLFDRSSLVLLILSFFHSFSFQLVRLADGRGLSRVFLPKQGKDKLILFVGPVRNSPCTKARQLFASALQIVWHEFRRRLLTVQLSLTPFPILHAVTPPSGYRVSIYSFLLGAIAPSFRYETFPSPAFFFSSLHGMSLRQLHRCIAYGEFNEFLPFDADY